MLEDFILKEMFMKIFKNKKPLFFATVILFGCGVTLFGASPTVTSTPSILVDRGSEYNYVLTGSDADKDSLSWSETSGTSLPSWLELKSNVVTTVTGDIYGGYEDGAAESAKFSTARNITIDSNGNLYVSELYDHIIRKVTPDGNVTTFAGVYESSGNSDGVGGDALFNQPRGLAVDSQNNLFVADYSNTSIRKITPDGNVTTFATGDGLGYTHDIAIDEDDKLYVVGSHQDTIHTYTAQGVHSTITMSSPFTNGYPTGITLDTATNTMYIINTSSVVSVTQDGNTTLVAGDAENRAYVDGVGSEARFSGLAGIVRTSNGELYLSDSFNSAIRRIGFDGNVSTVTELSTSMNGLALDEAKGLYIAAERSITKLVFNALMGTSPLIDTDSYDINLTVSDNNGEEGYQNFTLSSVNHLPAIASTAITVVDESSLYHYMPQATDNDFDTLTWSAISLPEWLSFDPLSYLSTLAGSGTQGSQDGDVSQASFRSPRGMTTDSLGNIYIADTGNRSIRKISPLGEVSTFAPDAYFSYPYDIVCDADDNLYVTDRWFHRIMKITPAEEVSIFAGSLDGSSGYIDSNTDTARFNQPMGITINSQGDLFVADYYNHRIRKISALGEVSTLAGNGTTNSYINANGIDAGISYPNDIVCDNSDTLYVSQGTMVRKITPNADVTFFAGTTAIGDIDGLGDQVRFTSISNLTIDKNGIVYVYDNSYRKIRKILPMGIVSTFVGGTDRNVDGNLSVASFGELGALALDKQGNLLLSNISNNKIQKINLYPQLSGTPQESEVGIYDVNLSVSDSSSFPVKHNFQITVQSAEYAPTSNDIVKNLKELSLNFQASDFEFNDLDMQDTLQGIYITTLQSAGNLTLEGNNITLNQFIPTTDIDKLTWITQVHTQATPYGIFGFKVYDGDTSSLQEYTVTLNVDNPNNEPILTANTSISMNENTELVTTIIAQDNDGDILNYSIVGGVDSSYFNLDSQSGALSFIMPPNAEIASDDNGDNIYEVQVNVDDTNILFETIIPNDIGGNLNAAYGSSIAIDGNYVLVGAPYASEVSDPTMKLGAAYLLKREDNGTLRTIQKISYPNVSGLPGIIPPEFGLSVSIDGDYLAIGALKDNYIDTNPDNDNGGSVYIYKKDINGTFMLHQQVVGDDTVSQDYFGRRVIIKEDKLIVSAPQHYHNGDRYTGKVYVFKQGVDGNFSQEQALVVDDISKNDLFGSSMAYENGYLVIGARGHLRSKREKTGLAYVFKTDIDGNFQKIAQLIPEDIGLGLNKQFGSGLNISGNTIVVSDPQYNSNRSFGGVGSAYVFKNDGSDSFTQVQQFFGESSNVENSRFARNPGLEDDILVLGAPDENKAYIYNKGVDGNFTLTQTLEDTQSPSVGLGYFTTVQNSIIAIGHIGHNDSTGAVLFSKKGDTKNFLISVNNVNESPMLQSITTQTKDEDFSPYTIELNATDIDSTNLTYTAYSNDNSLAEVNVRDNILTITSLL